MANEKKIAKLKEKIKAGEAKEKELTKLHAAAEKAANKAQAAFEKLGAKLEMLNASIAEMEGALNDLENGA